MLAPVVAVLVVAALVLMVWGAVAARRDRAPGRAMVATVVGTAALLLLQAVLAGVRTATGDGPEGSTVLFVSYLVTTAAVLPLALLWLRSAEPDRWSSAVVAVAGFTAAVLVVRLWDLWTGGFQIGAPPGA